MAGALLGTSLAAIASAQPGPLASGIGRECLTSGGVRRIIGVAGECRDNLEAFGWLLAGAPGM
jgi:hypothetical protein